MWIKKQQVKLVERWKLDCAILQTDGYCNVQLKKDIKVKVGEKYELIIRPRLQDGKGLALELSRPSVITGHANVKGEKIYRCLWRISCTMATEVH